LKKTVIFILFTIISLGLSAQEDSCALSPNELWIKTIQHKLDSITDKVKGQRYSAGYCIMDLTDDSVIYRYNDQKMLKPASTQKLFVATTLLNNLSRDYEFRTQLYVDGNVAVDSVGRRYLKGDICIRGTFDPTLQLVDIEPFAQKIVALRIDSIDGQIIADNRVKLDVKKIKDVPKYFAENLYHSLVSKGVAFSSAEPYSSSTEPLARGWCLATIATPVNRILNVMLKKSDNGYAECVLQNLCGMGRNSGWSYEACKGKVQRMVSQVTDSTSNYIIADGSGLSYSNRCSSELLVDLLRYDYKNPDIFPSIYENLPIAGIDGTLSKRMKNAPLYNNVRAKTGTLNDTSTLAGYVTSSNGHFFAFAVMVNNLGGLSAGKALQESICSILAK